MKAPSKREPKLHGESDIRAAAEEIAVRVRPLVPASMKLTVEASSADARIELTEAGCESRYYPIAIVDRSGISVRGERGTFRRVTRSVRRLGKVIELVLAAVPRHVGVIEAGRTLSLAWHISEDITTRLRASRVTPDDDAPPMPMKIGTHLEGTDISIRVPNLRVVEISDELEFRLQELLDLIDPKPSRTDARPWRLIYEEEDGSRHALGGIRHPGPRAAATTRLMELYWDDRLDTVGCSPIVIEDDEDEDDEDDGGTADDQDEP